MFTNTINLADFENKGTIKSTLTQEGLNFSLNTTLRTEFHKEIDTINTYAFLPQKFHLPVKINFTANTNGNGFYLLFGTGRVNFNYNYNDNNRSYNDIVAPDLETKNRIYNFLPKNKDVMIQIIYDYKFMQVYIDGEERYFSTKEKYMKSRLTKEKNTEGFGIRFAIEQSEKVLLKQFSVTQYNEGESPDCVRPTKEEIIARTSAELKTWYDWRTNSLAELPAGENNRLNKLYIDIFDYINKNYSVLFQKTDVIETPIKVDEACMKYLYDFALDKLPKDFNYNHIFENIGLYNSNVLPLLKEFAVKCSLNKSNGYYAFLKCDLRELKRKTRPDLESFMYYLTPELKSEISSLDNHLMSLKNFKLNKSVESYDFYRSNITVAYQSKMGFIYKLSINGEAVSSHGSWYVITSRSPWYRLNDYSEDMFKKIAETSPESAKELFFHYNKCNACCPNGCAVGTDYFYAGKKVRACHGRMRFGSTVRDFELIKLYVDTTDDLIKSGNPGEGMTTAPFYK